MIVLLKPKTNIDDNTKHNSALQKNKKKKKSQSGTFLGQLINIAIYNMDGNDKIIYFIGIIKLEFAKNKRKTILRYRNG